MKTIAAPGRMGGGVKVLLKISMAIQELLAMGMTVCVEETSVCAKANNRDCNSSASLSLVPKGKIKTIWGISAYVHASRCIS